MTPDDLKARTKRFAVDVIRFAKTIPRITSTMKSRRARRDRALGAKSTTGINNQQRIVIPESKINNDPHLELPDDASASRLRP